MVSGKKISLRFSHYKSMAANDPREFTTPWGVASLTQTGFIDRIDVGDH